ncbi:MAG: hypothetical protein GY722_21685, partial [bacterium]|nr:hypothetical protein [bacterium]
PVDCRAAHEYWNVGAGPQRCNSLSDLLSPSESYARTLSAWHERFNAAQPYLSSLNLDERFRRTRRYYLAYFEAGFRIGRIDVHRFAFARWLPIPSARCAGRG